jgi:hypothetical protein
MARAEVEGEAEHGRSIDSPSVVRWRGVPARIPVLERTGLSWGHERLTRGTAQNTAPFLHHVWDQCSAPREESLAARQS